MRWRDGRGSANGVGKENISIKISSSTLSCLLTRGKEQAKKDLTQLANYRRMMNDDL